LAGELKQLAAGAALHHPSERVGEQDEDALQQQRVGGAGWGGGGPRSSGSSPASSRRSWPPAMAAICSGARPACRAQRMATVAAAAVVP
jgi:hypothetical protein